MSTVRDLIKGSLREIGAIAPGETPSSDEAAEALLSLNSMISSWSNEELALYGINKEQFTLSVGNQTRTMGSGGQFNTTMPVRIERAMFKHNSSSLELPIEIIPYDRWAAIPLKNTSGEFPQYLWVQDGAALKTLYFWPVPTVAHYVELYSWRVIAAFSTLDDTISLPAGYEEALKHNLAIRLSVEYGRPISDDLRSLAVETKGVIKSVNARPAYMAVDVALSGGHGFNWRTGEAQ